MEQFEKLEEVLKRLSDLGATRFFFKALQENDNSKQQIYIADRPASVGFLGAEWEIDAESAIPKASVDFFWVTPSDRSAAPHAKVIYYPSYPEVRLSGLLLDSPLAPRSHMQPIPKSQRQGQDGRVLILGVSPTGTIYAHLATQESAVSAQAIALKSSTVVTELQLADGIIEIINNETADENTTQSSSEFGVEIESPEDESEDNYSDDDLFSISSWGADLSFRELITRYDEDELVKPELQRHYVWDKSEASRFIDSILIGLPVPSIFLAKTKDEKLLIIDGYQRLMTVRDYIRGVFSKDSSVFKLSKTDRIHERWRGKSFTELDKDEQRKIRNTTIHAIIFMQQHPNDGDTSLFQVFERINSSGRSLLPQEIRNCVYQGKFNSLLIELNKVLDWRELWGSESRDDRMRDIEFILRFFALSSDQILTSSDAPPRISLKKYLNQFMGRSIDDAESEAMRAKFVETVTFIRKHLGKSAFHNISQTGASRRVSTFSPTVFDSVMISTTIAIQQGRHSDVSGLQEKRINKLQDPSYQKLLYQETMRTPNIRLRVSEMLDALY
jgi:hypothetical protein